MAAPKRNRGGAKSIRRKRQHRRHPIVLVIFVFGLAVLLVVLSFFAPSVDKALRLIKEGDSAGGMAMLTTLSEQRKNVDALTILGEIRLRENDYPRARTYLEQAALLGGVQAKALFGEMLLFTDSRGNASQGKAYLAEAARAGMTRAVTALGYLKAAFPESPIEIFEGITLLNTAIRQGSTDAKVLLGTLHVEGMLDLREGGLNRLQQAAASGHPSANLFLAKYHCFGLYGMPSFVRRELEQSELTALLDAAPLYLRLLFETALCSGLRRGELRALTLDHLSQAKSTLRIDASRDKARERRHQILPKRLLEPLLEFARSGEPERLYALHYRGKKAKELAIPEKPLLFVPVHTARALKRVAVRAGVEIENGEGKIDFHALRTAYINMLIASGADPKTVMELSRHATASVTFKHYGRANARRMTQAAEAVGKIVLGGENAQITPRQKSGAI